MLSIETLEDEGNARNGQFRLKFGFAAMLLGVLILNLANFGYPLLDHTVFTVFAVLVAIPFLGYIYIKRRKAQGVEVWPLMRLNTQLLFVPLLWALVVLANGALDRSPSQAHSSVVIKKHESKGKGGTCYFLEVSSWRQGRSSEELKVKDETFERFQIGDQVVVETCHGLFGIVWVKSISGVE